MKIEYPIVNPTRKEKIDFLETKISEILNGLNQPGDVDPQVFVNFRNLKTELEIVRMNKYNSAFFEYHPHIGLNRRQRRQRAKTK